MSDPVVVVCRRPGYVIGLEQHGDVTLTHMDVTARWTPALKRAAQRDLDAIFEMHGGPLHAISAAPHNGDVAKHAKFLALMGYQFNKMVPCADGETRAAYTRSE